MIIDEKPGKPLGGLLSIPPKQLENTDRIKQNSVKSI